MIVIGQSATDPHLIKRELSQPSGTIHVCAKIGKKLITNLNSKHLVLEPVYICGIKIFLGS